MKTLLILIVIAFLGIEGFIYINSPISYEEKIKDPLYQWIEYDRIRINCRIQKGWNSYTPNDIVFCDNLAFKYTLESNPPHHE